MLDWFLYISFRVIYQALGFLPHRLVVRLFGSVWLALFKLLPRLRRTIETNIRIVFPAESEQWRRKLVTKHAKEMGRLTADIIRLPSLDADWMTRNVRLKGTDAYLEAHKTRGVLVASGHLGSFELLGHVTGLMGGPVAAVARRFKSERLNSWWERIRSASGNTIIDRNGAFKKILRTLRANTSVAVLFDQNVKRKHAEFVPWFSELGATTRAMAIASIQTDCPIFIASISYGKDGLYEVWYEELNIWELRRDTEMPDEEKTREITARISEAFCERIKLFPEGWFWTHRRWKTRPTEEEASLY